LVGALIVIFKSSRKIATMAGKRKAPEAEKPATTAAPTDAPKASKADILPKTKEHEAAEALISTKPVKPMTKAREIRLEQNRKAARESRRRKKVMVEELQRSVIFFSRANGTLKQQNDELSRLLVQAQQKVAALEGKKAPASKKAKTTAKATASSSAAASSPALPTMQPGATMQAMANFQQAASAAMQEAAKGMQGFGLQPISINPPPGTSAHQAYNDAMMAMTMQQSAASRSSAAAEN
jgi:hypothetical protein